MVLLSSKEEHLYKIVFESITNIVNNNNNSNLSIETVVTDSEQGLVNVIKQIFPYAKRIACFFHFKQDIIRSIKTYGLWKKEYKNTSKNVISKLSSLPFCYKGDINIIKNTISELSEKYPIYQNFLNNYFMKYKIKDFVDNSLDYNIIIKIYILT